MPIGFIADALASIGSFIGAGVADLGVDAGIVGGDLAASAAGGLGAADLGVDAGLAAGVGSGLAAGDAGLAAGIGGDLAASTAAGIGAGVGDAGLAAGTAGAGLVSDAAGGATIAEGVPLAATYGPTSAFATGDAAGASGLAAGDAGGLVSDAAGGATVADGAPLASTYGPTSTFATDTGSLSSTAGALGGGTPSLTTGSGLSASTPLASSPSALPTAPGAGASAFAPPSSIGSSALDPTTALAQSQGGSLFSGAVDSTSVSPTDAVLDQGAAGTLPGQTATAADSQAAVDQAGAGGALPGGEPTAPPFGGSVGASVSDFFDNAGSLASSPAAKVAGIGISGVGLVSSLLKSNTPNPIPGEAQLAQLATELGQTGAGLIAPNAAGAENVASAATGQASTLENYLTTGTLPPAVQASLDQATQSAITDIKGQFAARGEPPGSSAELQDIEAVKQNAVIQGGSLAASLYSQGVGLDQLASQIYTGLVGSGTSAASAGVGAQESVVSTNTAINTGLNAAIGNLASALGGGSKIIVNGTTATV